MGKGLPNLSEARLNAKRIEHPFQNEVKSGILLHLEAIESSLASVASPPLWDNWPGMLNDNHAISRRCDDEFVLRRDRAEEHVPVSGHVQGSDTRYRVQVILSR